MHHNEEKQEYVSLPYFGLNKLIPYLKPYKWTILSMVVLSLLGALVDIILPLFQRYALNHYIAGNTLDTLMYFIFTYD